MITCGRVFGPEDFTVRALADQLVDGEPTVRTWHRVQTEPLTHPVVVHRCVRCKDVDRRLVSGSKLVY